MQQQQIKEKTIQNTKIAIITQILVLATSLIKSFFIPLITSVESYGYWQIYLLYLPYIGLFYLGFNDGIYLRYGNYDYEDIPEKKFRGSIRIFLSFLITETLLYLICLAFFQNNEKTLAIAFVLINIPIKGIYGTLIYVLQITNNIKKYCFYSLIDKAIFLLLLVIVFIAKQQSFVYLILADIVSTLITTVCMLYENRKIIIGKTEGIKEAIKEFKMNIRVGISLMIASFMALILSNIGKIFVERFNNIEEYAYYSFGMTVINLLLVCFTSIGTVMYPMLKRIDEKEYKKQYNTLNKYFDIMALSGLLLYFIAYWGVKIIFTKYIPVLEYLNILFAVVIFQGKITLLNNTYYKILRQEKRMLVDNIVSIVAFIILCVFARSTIMVSIITLIVMAHRCIDSEIFLRKRMDIVKENTILILLIGVGIFIFMSSINYIIGVMAYTIFYIAYFLKNREVFINFIKLIIKRKK